MELKLLQNHITKDKLIIFKNTGHEREQLGWTLGVPVWIDGELGNFAWYDLASGNFYNHHKVDPQDTKIIFENTGGVEKIISLAKEFLKKEI